MKVAFTFVSGTYSLFLTFSVNYFSGVEKTVSPEVNVTGIPENHVVISAVEGNMCSKCPL